MCVLPALDIDSICRRAFNYFWGVSGGCKRSGDAPKKQLFSLNTSATDFTDLKLLTNDMFELERTGAEVE